MANIRYISTAFWDDAKVVDDFTAQDRYIYLYCMTNPHTTLCGCYEISIKQIAAETGYTPQAVLDVIKRLDEIHNVLRYNGTHKELLLLNWSKYNWTTSNKIDGSLLSSIRKIKTDVFRAYVGNIYNNRGSIKVQYDCEQDAPTAEPEKAPKQTEKPAKHKHGQYGWVKLTDAEHERLVAELGADEMERCIKYVDESAQSTGNKNRWKDWNLVLRKCSKNGWGLRPAGTAAPATRPSATAGVMGDLQELYNQFGEGD